MNYKVVVTESFKKHTRHLAKKYPSFKTDLPGLVESLEMNPMQGQSIGKECFKVRMAIGSKGKGKSGGARVIICVKIINQLVFMLAVYDKSEKESISDHELDALLKIVGLL